MRKPLSALRKERGFTQSRLADKVKVTTSAVGNWESGTRIPRLPTIRRIAEVLEVDIDDIEFGEANATETTSGMSSCTV